MCGSWIVAWKEIEMCFCQVLVCKKRFLGAGSIPIAKYKTQENKLNSQKNSIMGKHKLNALKNSEKFKERKTQT